MNRSDEIKREMRAESAPAQEAATETGSFKKRFILFLLLAALCALTAWPAKSGLDSRIRFNANATLTSGTIAGGNCDTVYVEELGITLNRERGFESSTCLFYIGKRVPVSYDPGDPKNVIVGLKRSYAGPVFALLLSSGIGVGAAIMLFWSATAVTPGWIRKYSVLLALLPPTFISALISWWIFTNLQSIQNFNKRAVSYSATSNALAHRVYETSGLYGRLVHSCYRYIEIEKLEIGFVKVTGDDERDCITHSERVRFDSQQPRDLVIGSRITELWHVLFLTGFVSVTATLLLAIFKLASDGVSGAFIRISGNGRAA